jgi:cation diffusion facilitator CzcD-associated flavoprotein CzcO
MHHQVAIVGSGFSGLGMAIRLLQEGFEDFVVLEKAQDVGGTWRDNTYPGCACDVPSHLYSFSFAPNPQWPSTFSAQPEIQAYLQDCARRYGVLPHVRFGHEVTAADWDDEQQHWRIETSQGPLTASVMIAGSGPFSGKSVPDLPGLETFEGASWHSAEWDHDHDLTGERVAVVGTGASAIQFVPEIQPVVGKLTLFQRTPAWVIPRRDRRLTRLEHALYRRFPAAQLLMRAGIYWARETFVLQFRRRRVGDAIGKLASNHLTRQVRDRDLRRKLRPRYAMGCKRVLISNDFYPALTRDNAEVVTEAITEVRPRSLVTADGTEHEVDTIIWGTGFHVVDRPIAEMVRGRDGRTLADVWDGSPQAYLGTSVAGFPNAFVLVGPNTGLGHNSIVFMIESQVNYIVGALKAMREAGAAAVEPRPDAQQRFIEEMERESRKTVWVSGGCQSYYLDRKGRNSTLWPTFTWPFRERTRRFDPAMHILHPAAAGDRELAAA